jgi:hypothetical protein
MHVPYLIRKGGTTATTSQHFTRRNIMATITINVPELSDLPEYMELVKEQLEEGFTSGHVTYGHYWVLAD